MNWWIVQNTKMEIRGPHGPHGYFEVHTKAALSWSSFKKVYYYGKFGFINKNVSLDMVLPNCVCF